MRSSFGSITNTDLAVDLDSWGDDPAVIQACEQLAFAVVERVGGWQLRLA
jgi:hypothetical protein